MAAVVVFVIVGAVPIYFVLVLVKNDTVLFSFLNCRSFFNDSDSDTSLFI